METAPLTLAHTHARNAVLETKRSNPVAASEEHDLAAADFATAAQSSSDNEAKRILILLEQHHKRLGEILKSPNQRVTDAPNAQTSSSDPPAQSITSPTPKSEGTRAKSPEITAQPPRLSRAGGTSGRELSSSIASNLASARGIPNSRPRRSAPISPLVSNQYADGHFTQDENHRNTPPQQSSGVADKGSTRNKPATSRPSWTPPVAEDEELITTNDKSDAPFQQFYSTFENLLSRISAPLAFAGLPLTGSNASKASLATTAPPKSPTNPKPKNKNDEQTSQPDYSQLISRAALRAVSGITNHPAESFYVVPTSGGTTSYAEIMTRVDREESRVSRHRRETSDTSNLSRDDFVDAQSTILIEPHGGNDLSRTRRHNQEIKVNGKTMEELALENQALKHLSDTLAKRLHVFEMSAQTSSAALAQSIRSIQRSPLATPEHSRGKSALNKTVSAGSTAEDAEGTGAMSKRIAELEHILAKSDAKAKKRDEENAKLRETLIKYRDKWENLKAGAKARREGQVKDREREGHRDRERDGHKRTGGGATGIKDKAVDDGGGSAA